MRKCLDLVLKIGLTESINIFALVQMTTLKKYFVVCDQQHCLAKVDIKQIKCIQLIKRKKKTFDISMISQFILCDLVWENTLTIFF